MIVLKPSNEQRVPGYETKAAWALGIALPLLEIARRRNHFHPFASYVDDFIAGGLLLWSAIAVQRGASYGRYLLCAAWGVLCGGLYGSFFGQIYSTFPNDISGLKNWYVVAIKGCLLIIAMVSLVQSIRNSTQNLNTGNRIS